jgi:hypothetical protein
MGGEEPRRPVPIGLIARTGRKKKAAIGSDYLSRK